MKPYFIGIGAQKSGTSWIYANLNSHPEINMPVKEIHFFSRNRFEENGVKWYENHFKKIDKKNGEFSTSYLFCKKTASRIFELYPDVKILAVLRNPINRAYSNYSNDIMAGKVNKGVGFFSVLDEHPEYIDQGFYDEQIKKYLEYFDLKNIKIMIYEDIKSDPELFMKEIYEFLNVDPNFLSPLLHKKINPSYIPKNQKIGKFANYFLDKTKKMLNVSIINILKKTRLHELLKKSNRKNFVQVKKGFNENDKNKLFEIFKQSIIELELLIQTDLSHWKI